MNLSGGQLIGIAVIIIVVFILWQILSAENAVINWFGKQVTAVNNLMNSLFGWNN